MKSESNKKEYIVAALLVFFLFFIILWGIGEIITQNNASSNGNISTENNESLTSSTSDTVNTVGGNEIVFVNDKEENFQNNTQEDKIYPAMSEDPMAIYGEMSDDPMASELERAENEDYSALQYTIDPAWNTYETENELRILKDGSYTSESGISVSYYQGNIDWNMVREKGYSYAMIRVGYRGYERGELHKDIRFAEYMEEASDAGIKRGAYFYSQAINKDEFDEEIDFLLNAIKGYDIAYPVGIVFDRYGDAGQHEASRAKMVSDSDYISYLRYYCLRVQEAGYVPVIYDWDEHFEMLQNYDLSGCLKWVYSGKDQLSITDNCAIWQYRNYANVPGIQVKVSVSFSMLSMIETDGLDMD